LYAASGTAYVAFFTAVFGIKTYFCTSVLKKADFIIQIIS